MADEKDERVAGPDPAPPAQHESPPPPPVHGEHPPPPPPPGTAPPPSAAAPPPAAHPSAPPPPTAPPGPGWRTRGRDWGGRRPVQLLAAGLVGALLGGGLVALLDVLDDDGHDRAVRIVEGGGPDGRYGPYGPGWRRRGPEQRFYPPAPPPDWWWERKRPPTEPTEPTPSPRPSG